MPTVPDSEESQPRTGRLREGASAAAGAGRGRAERPRPNFFLAVRLDDPEVVRNVCALQQHLIREDDLRNGNNDGREVLIREDKEADVNNDVDTAVDVDLPQDPMRPEAKEAQRRGMRKEGLSKFIIDAERKLHVTLIVLCIPNPTMLSRAQELCRAWLNSQREPPFDPVSSYSVYCFGKGLMHLS